jgi:tricarballylate dehydrogenase
METRNMGRVPHRLVIVGHGAAGLTAAIAAAEAARFHDRAVEITLMEKAAQESAGGNTLWSPSYMRLDARDRIAPDFEDAMMEASDGRGDRQYFASLASNATATVGWLESHGVTFCSPPYYLSAGPLRIQPVGGGRAIVDTLSRAAKGLGVVFQYGRAAKRIVMAGNGRVGGVVASDDNGTKTIPADAVILAAGGFQADGEMMRAHFGPGGESFRLISPGTRYNSGDGIRMALAQGAHASGDWNGMHAEPIDPRSENSAPVVLVYPYGIVVDQNGRRFFDEGGGLVHETWERFARQIHFETPGGKAYAILDSRLFDIAGFERAIRSEVPPYQADTLEGLAHLVGIDSAGLAETVATYNRAATGDPTKFDAARCDGLAASSWLDPPKSNWARAIARPPFLAYPVVGAVAYTFGGIATNEKAEVLGEDGPLPGLYAAGEITGHFWGTAPNAVSVLRALVFGRIAGREAISYFESTREVLPAGADATASTRRR